MQVFHLLVLTLLAVSFHFTDCATHRLDPKATPFEPIGYQRLDTFPRTLAPAISKQKNRARVFKWRKTSAPTFSGRKNRAEDLNWREPAAVPIN